MKALLLVSAVLAGCASPEYVARQGDFDVCRLSMGGPHSANASAEARGRGLNCQALYPAINARMAAENAAVQQIFPAPQTPPRPLTCTTYRAGNSLATDCF